MKLKSKINILLFTVIFFLLQFIIGFVLRGDLDSYSRIMMHELHSVEKIDTLFIGASHAYRGLQPDLIDKELNCNSFVASTANQTLEGSYALLREVKLFHPELNKVYVDVDYSLCFTKLKDKDLDLKRIYAISNYLKNPKIKYDFLLNATSIQQYFYNFSSIGKGKVTVDPKKVTKTLLSYINGDYWKYEYPVDKKNNEYYEGRGFIAAESTQKDVLYNPLSHTHFKEEDVSKDWLNALFKIIEFCNEENIQLKFISIPESNYFVLVHENFDDFHDYITEILSDKNCDYYDFNLVNDKYLHLTVSDFYDDNHLNRAGSEKFNLALTKLLKNESLEDDFFYENIKDKKLKMDKNIYGINVTESDDLKSFDIITYDNVDTQSEITFDYISIDKNNIENILKLNTADLHCDYPKNFSGKIKVNCYINNVYNCSFEQKVNTIWVK